jgi:hypothetical protein
MAHLAAPIEVSTARASPFRAASACSTSASSTSRRSKLSAPLFSSRVSSESGAAPTSPAAAAARTSEGVTNPAWAARTATMRSRSCNGPPPLAPQVLSTRFRGFRACGPGSMVGTWPGLWRHRSGSDDLHAFQRESGPPERPGKALGWRSRWPAAARREVLREPRPARRHETRVPSDAGCGPGSPRPASRRAAATGGRPRSCLRRLPSSGGRGSTARRVPG